MKTICTLNGRIIMSQDGSEIVTMQANASQYPSAVVEVVTTEEFNARLEAQPKTPEEIERDSQSKLRADAKALAMFDTIKGATLAQINSWVDVNFNSMTSQQRSMLKLLAAVAGLYLRER